VNVLYFLTERLKFIRQFYATGSTPYLERKRKIEAGAEPFVPPYSEDGEPPFMAEWLEADESLHVLAYTCVSMLAAALHLYFETWVKESGRPVSPELKKIVFKKHGWLEGYKEHFGQTLQINFDEQPANFRLLEEVILARNLIEHPPSIASIRTQFADADLKKLRHPFFVDEREAALLTDEGERTWFVPPTLHVSEAQLIEAVSEVERLATWFEPAIERRLYGQ
jgi:hypothetical protein